MSDVRDYDFSMERRLRKLNSELHKRFTDTVFALQYNLSNYKRIFPEFTGIIITKQVSGMPDLFFDKKHQKSGRR